MFLFTFTVLLSGTFILVPLDHPSRLVNPALPSAPQLTVHTG